MKKTFRSTVLFAIILIMQLSLILPNVANADAKQVSLTELSLKVMPEFINPEGWDANTPSLLIGYHGTFTNHSDQPYDGELKVSVPTNLPQFTPGYVAQFKEETEEYLEMSYEISEEGKYFAWTPSEPIPANGKFSFILEFYSASVNGEVEKSFNYQYTTENKMDSVSVEIYTPFRVEDLKINKEPTEKANSFGLEIDIFKYSDLDAGEVLDYDVSYTKDNIVTTVEAFNDMSAPEDEVHAGLNDGTNEQTSQTDNGSDSLISTENAILIAITIILVGAFLFIVLRKKTTPTKGKKETKKAPKKIVNKEDEIKKLRKMLAEGQIDEKIYKEKRSKLG